MFRPNLTCSIEQKSGYDIYGIAIHGEVKTEHCALVRNLVSSVKTSVRTDSSASHGNAQEIQADVLVLVYPKTTATIGAVIGIGDERFMVKSKQGRYSIAGRLDHYEMGCVFWEDGE